MSETVQTARPGLSADAAEITAWLTEVFAELGLTPDESEDDFFALGGTSLSAMRLIARAEERYGEDALPPEDLYERPGVAQIAESIARNVSATAGAEAAADGR